MNFDDICETVVYEVLDETTHKYASTKVSGGGGNALHVSEVRSTTDHHSDQILWLKNISTGEEKKFEFDTFNVSARPGHKLYFVINRKTKNVLRIVNLKTKDSYVLDSVFKEIQVSKIKSTFFFLISAFLIAIPGLIAVYFFFTWFNVHYVKSQVAKIPSEFKASIEKSRFILMSIMGSLMCFGAIALLKDSHKLEVIAVRLIMLSAIPLAFAFIKLYVKLTRFTNDVTKLVNDHVAEFVYNHKHDDIEIEHLKAQSLRY